MTTTNVSTDSTTVTAPQGVKPPRAIKLGVDVHWREYVVVGGRKRGQTLLFAPGGLGPRHARPHGLAVTIQLAKATGDESDWW